jgi:hypothetical protein
MNPLRILGCALFSGVFALVLFTTPEARADVVYIWAEEVGGDVIFRHQGSIDLTGFPAGSTVTGGAAAMDPSNGGYVVYATGGELDVYDNVLPEGDTRTFGSGALVLATSFSGATFGVDMSDAMALPVAYVSGTPFMGTTTFAGATFQSLGITPTPFSFDTILGTNTIRFFQTPPSSAGGSAPNLALQAKIKKLQKLAKAAAKKGNKAKAERLGKKIKKLRALLG